MKVLHITRGFGDYAVEIINGVSRYAESSAALSLADEWIAEHLDNDVRRFFSKAPSVSRIGNIPAIGRIIRLIARERPDVIHIQAGVVWELLLLHVFPTIAKVVTVHDVVRHPSKESGQLILQGVIDHAARAADAVIVHGEALRADALKRFGRDMDIFVVPHATISRYGEGIGSTCSRNGGRVLLFGTLDEWKGVEYLVAAERRIRQTLPSVEICIAGRAVAPDYYRSLVESDQQIQMDLRRQSDEDVRRLFQWADVVVLPYIEASQSGVLQLAFAFGLPTVVSDVGSLAEVVTNRITGLVVQPRNIQQLADSVIEILVDSNLREKVINNVVDQRRQRLSRDSVGRKTVEIYEFACSKRKQ
jgi:starch synthase